MNTKFLIDAIVRRTTVLVAQLSTAAGIRAPLAHVADQVFLDLARELEAQGLGKKVVADMFGLALRGYQKRVQRLAGSVTVRDQTLWEAVLAFVREHDGVLRKRAFERFERDDDESIAAVLKDLVSSGLVMSSGQGLTTMYRATSESELRRIADAESDETLSAMTWAVIFHHPGIDLAGAAEHLGIQAEALRGAVLRLCTEGRVECRDTAALAGLRARTLLVPIGAEAGWEGAVYDHFQAVANAIASKVRLDTQKSEAGDRIGGTTLHFEICAGHPHEAEVYGQLAALRASASELWGRVCEYNRAHPISEEDNVQVSLYFGQNVVGADQDGATR